MEESITVASPTLTSKSATSPSMVLPAPETPILGFDFVYMAAASPTTSSSSLSEPASEPNSPGLFTLGGLNIKMEPAEDCSSDILGDVTGVISSHSSSIVTSTFARPNGSQLKPRARRGVDPCADSEMVEALRVANAIANTEDENEDFTIPQMRSLRTSNRLGRSRDSIFSGLSHQGSSINKPLGVSNKRGRSSHHNQLVNITSDQGIAIKQELIESNEIEMNTPHSVASPTLRKKKIRRPPVKKQKVNSTPKSISDSVPGFTKDIGQELHTSSPNGGKQGSITATANETTFSGTRKKGVKKRRSNQSWVELKDTADQISEKEQAELQQKRKFRASVPPRFTFRYTSPFNLDKGPLYWPRSWSAGAEDPGSLPRIVPVIELKNGILTDAVTITSSRLRPRKLTGNPNLGSFQPRKPRQPRKKLNIKKEPGIDLEANFQPKQDPKKRTLEFTDEATGESSDDSTLTEDEYLEDETSDTLDKTDEGGKDLEEEDDELDDDIDDEYATMSIRTEDGHQLEARPRKRQKLSHSDNKFITDIKDIDPRLWPGVATLVNGIYMIPRGCHL